MHRAASTRIVHVLDCSTSTGYAGQASICDTSSTIEYCPFALAPLVVHKNFIPDHDYDSERRAS
jgi:hypothetical protein